MKKLPSICISSVLMGIIIDGLLLKGRVEFVFFILLFCWLLISFIFKISSKFQYKVVFLLFILGMVFSIGKNQISAGNPAEIFLRFSIFFLLIGLAKEIKSG